MSDWFAAPQWAWALLAVPCVYLFARAMESARKARIAFHLGPRFAAEDAADFGTAAWLATATLGCVLAAMQPQWGVEAARAERRGTDLVVGVDVSRSMLAADVEPDRMRAARADLAALLESGVDDRFALLAFAGEARRIVPLTDDRESFRGLIEIAEPAAVRRGGTDLAAALRLARTSFADETERARAIVLLTDGEDLEAQALQELDSVASQIPIHAVGYGSAAGSKIVIETDGQRSFLTDRAGEEVITALDARSLRALATRSGGSYRDADDDPGLVALRERLQQDAQALAPQEGRQRKRARFVWPLLLAFLCLVFAGGRMR